MAVPLPRPPRERSEHFQEQDVQLVLNTLLSGDSCHLVGLGSVGKSNFVRHLIRPAVKQTVMGNGHDNLIFVLLDPHSMLHLEGQALERSGSHWSGYELMLSRLHRSIWQLEMQNQQDPTPLMRRLSELRGKIFQPDPITAQTGLRQLETSLYEILHVYHPTKQICFIFDELETFKPLPGTFFESLRGLRDDNKMRLMYLTTARVPADEVLYKDRTRDERLVLESFAELLHAHTYYISPLTPNDTAEFVYTQLQQGNYRFAIDDVTAQRLATELYNLAGGHAGLLRRGIEPALYALRSTQNRATSDQIRDYLIADAGITKECAILVGSLSDQERLVLANLMEGRPVPDASAKHRQTLIDKHILNGAGTHLLIPLLWHYLRQNPRALVEFIEPPR